MRYIDPQQFISQQLSGRTKPGWEAAIICFRGLKSSGVLLDRLSAVPIGWRALSGMDYPGDRPYVYEAKIGGKPVAVVSGCWWGGPQAAIIIEELACLGVRYLGVRYIIGFGAAGSISNSLPKHSIVVAKRGLVTDGTSRAYTKMALLMQTRDFSGN